MTFTTHHLRFTVEVETTIEMNAFKGSALRGAWQSHLRTLYCAQTTEADPMHQAMCPVCYLLSRDTKSGNDRRPYAFIPPLTPQRIFQPEERFSFGISLFGQTVQFLPYLVLAVGQMGQAQGLGKPIHGGEPGDQESRAQSGEHRANRRAYRQGQMRRGTFRLVKIEEVNPITGQTQALMAEGDSMVQMPALPINQAAVAALSQQLAAGLAGVESRLTLTFLTPTRIVDEGHLVHAPQFRPFFARLVDRLDALQQQYAAQPRLPRAGRDHLLALAGQVALAEDQTHWWDLQGHSSRLKQRQKLGGFVGPASYQAKDPIVWQTLLPWLVWGTVTQVGKHVVKGCGWYEVRIKESAYHTEETKCPSSPT
jgi:hypothetical protein